MQEVRQEDSVKEYHIWHEELDRAEGSRIKIKKGRDAWVAQ